MVLALDPWLKCALMPAVYPSPLVGVAIVTQYSQFYSLGWNQLRGGVRGKHGNGKSGELKRLRKIRKTILEFMT